jgi:hypothetical protein
VSQDDLPRDVDHAFAEMRARDKFRSWILIWVATIALIADGCVSALIIGPALGLTVAILAFAAIAVLVLMIAAHISFRQSIIEGPYTPPDGHRHNDRA